MIGFVVRLVFSDNYKKNTNCSLVSMSIKCCYKNCNTRFGHNPFYYLHSKLVYDQIKNAHDVKGRMLINNITVQGWQWLCRTHKSLIMNMDQQQTKDIDLQIIYYGSNEHYIFWDKSIFI